MPTQTSKTKATIGWRSLYVHCRSKT